MASTDARPVPRKNVAYRVTFPILDADGDLVTAAASLDSEVSIDGGTFADCTNEATEIATSSGVYYLDLTSAEMNGDTVAVIVKTATSGAKTTVLVFYPEEAGDYRADVTHFGGTAGTFSGGRAEVNTSHIAGAAVSTSTAQLGVNVVNAGGTAWGSGAITAASIAADAIGASELAADAATEIANAVWALDATGQQTQGSFGQVLGDSGATAKSVWSVANALPNSGALTTIQADLDDIQARLPAALVSGRIDASVGAMAANVMTAAAAAADLTTEITSGLATATNVSDAQTAILAKLPAALVSGRIDASVGAMAANVITAAATASDFGAEVADAVWDEATSGHATAGTTGAALTAAAGAGDLWSTALPGAYSAGTAGNIIGAQLLRPTVAGRTLDVSTGGEAGIDWANVGSPTSAVTLSGTSIASTTAIAAGGLSADAITDAAVDKINDDVIEGTITLRGAVRLMLSALVGRLSGAAAGTPTFRDTSNTKNRIVAATTEDGRTSVTLDPS